MRFLCVPALFAVAASAQSAKLQFEVATVKLAPPVTNVSGVNITGGPGKPFYTYTGARMDVLLQRAYGLIDTVQQISGPDWIVKQRYDLNVKLPPDTNEQQFREMLRNLITDRFQMVIHHETKTLPVYELVVGKNGHKLAQSEPIPDAAPDAGPMKADGEGFPVVARGRSNIAMMQGQGPGGQPTQRWVFVQRPMDEVAGFLTQMTGRRVLDKTGLPGVYDFKLFFEPQPAGASSSPVPDHPILTVFDAIEQQLGLRLVDTKSALDLLVIDRAERVPTEN